MPNLTKRAQSIRKATPLASRVILDYQYWLQKHYPTAGDTYVRNAKTFLRSLKTGGTVISQLETYAEDKSLTIQSFLRRFHRFLDEKQIHFIVNDLNEKKLPKSNIYVKLFLLDRQDLLQGDRSSSTYAGILNGYFNLINDNLNAFNKRTAQKYILKPSHSDFTKRLYRSVLKTFCDWALIHQNTADSDLSRDQKIVKKGLRKISAQSLREIAAIKVKSSGVSQVGYHKDSLSERQRSKCLATCRSPRDRAIISLMAWNGLRSVEVLRATIFDCRFNDRKLEVWGKGRSRKNKDVIRFFDVPMKEIRAYLKVTKIKSGPLFPGLTKLKLSTMVKENFKSIGLTGKGTKYTPHSLRHTAGQLMYDKGIPLEYIQKTLRHKDPATTLMYAQRAVDRKYFKKMPRYY